MPIKVEKDAITGTETTGHEWDGIKELNSPLPKWWLYVFYATILWSVVWWVLYPSIPELHGYVHGVLGYNQRMALDDQLAAARQGQAVWRDRIEAASLQEIQANPDLLNFAMAGGAAAFADNCTLCHGLGGVVSRSWPMTTGCGAAR